jgi:hypothetical protein
MLVGTLNQQYLRTTYLRGIDLGEAWHGPSADAALDSLLASILDEAQGKIGVRFRTERVRTYPDPGLVLGVDYEIEGEPLTYFQPALTGQHFIIPLPFAHIQSIERIRLFYGNPTDNPLGRTVHTIPAEWIFYTQKEGVLKIAPNLTNTLLMTQYPTYYGLWYRPEIPGAWALDYTVGYGQVPPDVVHWVCLGAAIQVLAQAGAGAGVGAGVASESLSQDGKTESVSYVQGKYGPYSGLIESLMAQRECLNIWGLRRRHHGLKIAVW